MLAGRKFTAFSAVLVCAWVLGSVATEQPTPYPTPPGQDPGTRGATDTAYYLSTAAVEQEMIVHRKTAEGGLGLGVPEFCADAAGHVPQWGRFEIAIDHPGAYADPYRDVTLDVTFTRPDGSTIAFWGFYDGGDTWRIRALADQAGTWRYEATFSDGTGRFDGMFTCLESDIPGLISAYDDNPIWFGFKGDRPVLIRTLQVGERFLAESDDPVTEAQHRATFLDWVQEQGYNMLSIAGCLPNRGGRDSKRGVAASALWDVDARQPDPAAYRRFEWVLDDLAVRRMLVYPASGFFGRTAPFPKDSAQQDLFLRYTLARLAAYWNMVWTVGEPEPLSASESYWSREEIEQLGRKIKAMDPFGHLLCVSGSAGDDVFTDADWASCAVLQGPRTASLQRLSRVLLRNRNLSRPLYAQQTLWLGSRRQADYSSDELRKNAYVMMMSGATANLADMGGSPSSGLSGTLDLRQKVQPRHDMVKQVWDFFEQIPFWRMQPRQDLVDNGYCLAEPGRTYLVYLEHRDTVTVDVAEGMYQVKWINARDTADVREAGILEGRRDLTSPQEQDDWLLSLERVEIVAGKVRPY
jgi:hypothetical protein